MRICYDSRETVPGATARYGCCTARGLTAQTMGNDLVQGYDTSYVAVTITRPRPDLRQHGLRDALETLILVATIYALVNLSSARFIVEGDSMQPNFHTGQYLIVSRVNYLLGQPERGDIVVFHYPRDPRSDFIKRVIGLPGETVSLRGGQVYVNGEMLDEPYIREACTLASCPDSEWPIEDSMYFVMGDNRNESRDSRAFGPVHRSFFVGEALLRYWPPDDLGFVERPG